MKRHLEKVLCQWRLQEHPLPIVLRGARQVGKTYLVQQFAEEYFESAVAINFEKQPEYARCFTTLDPNEIIQKISAIEGRAIHLGKTLLFLDEVQSCPAAIQALRYFKEDLPGLHVIAAGSLLEFALNAKDFKMPVGRVQYLYLKPLSFLEYLEAIDRLAWSEQLKEATVENPVPEVLHEVLLKEVKRYMALGGMPAVIHQYLQQGAGENFQNTQFRILETYVDDFAKYATKTKILHLQTIFNQIPALLAQQTKYSKIDPDVHSRVLKEAIHCLELAGVIYRVYASAASGIPINAQLNFNQYKLFFLDVGLMAARSGLSASVLTADNVLTVNRGEMAEQFVCQELLAYQSSFRKADLQYWARTQKSSQAEVDFVMQYDAKILPIEVKAGSTGRLKSLQIMMAEKNLPCGVRISQQALSYDPNRKILSVPLYLISELERLSR